MPTGTNTNAFGADYTDIANCLFAIQALDDSGGLAEDATAQALLSVFKNALNKLYIKTVWVFGELEGIEVSPGDMVGDFEFLDFDYSDYNEAIVITLANSPGDFHYLDFSFLSFNVDLIDPRNSSYSSCFQTILNIFSIFNSRIDELSSSDIQGLNATLIPVLDAFKALQDYLVQAGISPCISLPSYFNNSPHIYLQATGSDGSSGVAEGIHLRWALTGDIGNNHLPQGDYYNSGLTPTGYNKANDYVILSRAVYDPVTFTVDFPTAIPAINYASRTWTYTINQTIAGQFITNTVRVVFYDKALYDQAANTVNPQVDAFAFLKIYNGLMGISIDNKYAYAVGYDFRLNSGATSALLKLELTSAFDLDGQSQNNVNLRKTIMANATVTETIFGDNINQIILQKNATGYLQSFSFETYDDFVNTRNNTAWTVVGSNFALSLTDTTVFERLESSAYPVDYLWPQYNDGTTVKVSNYHDKWLTTHANDKSVKETVQQYLLLSETDPRAEGIVKDDDAPPDAPGLLVSYLDVLNITALDYHWARMLGLGFIDAQINDAGGLYIYKVTYSNRTSLDLPSIQTFESLSYPTAKTDSRLPIKPNMQPISYSMPGDNGLMGQVFDSNGYANNANARLINISRELYNSETLSADFFTDASTSNDFDLFSTTDSILYGVKYRAITNPAYQKPEITAGTVPGYLYYAYDVDFPTTGVLESVLIPDNETSLYIHFEKNNGIHVYAIYGVNWFSRASVHSDERDTDATTFPINNPLIPPSDVTIQYIQEEDTLLFTTATEQNWLSGRAGQFPNGDISFTRLTFNWLDITDVSAIQDLSTVIKPTRVKPWFLPNQPLTVAGTIINIQPVNGDDTLLVLSTGPYLSIDRSTITPIILESDLPKFTGSLLSTQDGQFIVTAVANNLAGPVFTVKKIAQTTAEEDQGNPGLYGTNKTYILPKINTAFTVAENLTQPGNWQNMVETIELIDFGNPSSPVVESSTDEYGNTVSNLIGGIIGDAIVTQLNDTGGAPMPGYYSVSFPSVTLAPHPQVNLPFDPANPGANDPSTLQTPDVEWYNGLIRVPLADGTGDKKLVTVIRIVQTVALMVYVYDGSYQDDPIQTSSSGSDFILGVNYHPGYKVYLFPEPPPANAFNGTNILPSGDESNKKTLLGLQCTDTETGGSGFVSVVSSPVILYARKIVKPVQLEAPIIYNLKVRPDATTKAALTFDVKIAPDSTGAARAPYGFMFYRTTNEDVLYALYASDTVIAIKNSLNALTEDAFFNERYLELVNLIYDPPGSGNFKVFDALPAPYGFPVPDKPGLIDGTDITVAQKTAKYLQAIIATLLPLTAQPPVYTYIKEGKQTANTQPVTRDVDGNMLSPTDPAFDPYPMVRKYLSATEANTWYVRVTDYTLNGSSRFLYFYGAAEVTNQLQIGLVSPFAGGVIVLQTLPADASIIRSFTIGPPIVASASPVAVTFFVTPFSSNDPITKVRIYRTYSLNNSISLQTMDTHVDINVVTDDQGGIIVTDDFSDLTSIPYGNVIYYRLSFIRTISNERNELEDIVGIASTVSIVNFIDTINPSAPDISHTDSITETQLSWGQTTNKGTYYLYTQNSKGNWQALQTYTPLSPTDTMTYDIIPPLSLTDGDGNRIYYRYKVRVQNSAGLLNLTDNILTI